MKKCCSKTSRFFTLARLKSAVSMCPAIRGGTWSYLIDGKYLFTGDTIWFGADGGYSFISALAEDNKLAVRSLAELEARLKSSA